MTPDDQAETELRMALPGAEAWLREVFAQGGLDENVRAARRLLRVIAGLRGRGATLEAELTEAVARAERAEAEAARLRSGTYVVDYEPGLYGPFPTQEGARAWADRRADARAGDGITRSWCAVPINPPDETDDA